jgi:hypothetical protein
MSSGCREAASVNHHREDLQISSSIRKSVHFCIQRIGLCRREGIHRNRVRIQLCAMQVSAVFRGLRLNGWNHLQAGIRSDSPATCDSAFRRR